MFQQAVANYLEYEFYSDEVFKPDAMVSFAIEKHQYISVQTLDLKAILYCIKLLQDIVTVLSECVATLQSKYANQSIEEQKAIWPLRTEINSLFYAYTLNWDDQNHAFTKRVLLVDGLSDFPVIGVSKGYMSPYLTMRNMLESHRIIEVINKHLNRDQKAIVQKYINMVRDADQAIVETADANEELFPPSKKKWYQFGD